MAQSHRCEFSEIERRHAWQFALLPLQQQPPPCEQSDETAAGSPPHGNGLARPFPLGNRSVPHVRPAAARHPWCWGGMVSGATGSGAASTGMKKTAEMIVIGIGIVGCNYGSSVLIPALRHDPRCEAVALAGTEAALMAELAQAANVARGLGRGGAPEGRGQLSFTRTSIIGTDFVRLVAAGLPTLARPAP
jgi:hypothetical protein